MKRRLSACLLPAVLVLAPLATAHAEEAASPVTGSLAITSDYTFRGLSQTNRKPALQGGLQYDHGSGFYAGVWASSISWLSDYEGVSSGVEVDGYLGFKGGFAEDWSWDVGLNRYQYPGKYPAGFVSPNTTEIYASLGWKALAVKYWYGITNIFGFSDSEHSDYIELNLNQPLGGIWTLNAHVGRQTVDGFSDADYTDWKLGATVGLPHGFSLAAAYIDTNAEKAVYTNAYDKYLGKQTVVVTLTKAF